MQKPADDWTWQRRSVPHEKTVQVVYPFPDLNTDAQHVGRFVKPRSISPATSIITDRPVGLLRTKLAVMVILRYEERTSSSFRYSVASWAVK